MPSALRPSIAPIVGPGGEPLSTGSLFLGKYLVEHVLGEGGMGIVVVATHLQLDQKVAIKFLRPQAAKNVESVARFTREARAAARIQNEHVARVFDVGQLDTGTPYMVMEYLEGEDLDTLLEKRKRVSVEDAIDWVLQTCEALAEAHAVGIVHRDLKPANLFLARRPDATQTIKVLDFGISKVTDADGFTRSSVANGEALVAGSPAYMAPEQMKTGARTDARADIWSMGVILHELVNGKPPWDSPSIAELCAKVMTEPPPRLSHGPFGLGDVVLRCLEKDPSKRFTNVAQLARALEPWAPPRARGSVDRVARTLSVLTPAHGFKPMPLAEVVGPDSTEAVAAPAAAAAPAPGDSELPPALAPRRGTTVAAILIGAALAAATIVGVSTYAGFVPWAPSSAGPSAPATSDTLPTSAATATATDGPAPAVSASDVPTGSSPVSASASNVAAAPSAKTNARPAANAAHRKRSPASVLTRPQ